MCSALLVDQTLKTIGTLTEKKNAMVVMEHESSSVIRHWLGRLDGIKRKNHSYEDVAGRQILSALLRETGLDSGVKHGSYIYRLFQEVINEARMRGLLLNPNPYTREQRSRGYGNTANMRPCAIGWEQTKGILTRYMVDARANLARILRSRSAISRTQHTI